MDLTIQHSSKIRCLCFRYSLKVFLLSTHNIWFLQKQENVYLIPTLIWSYVQNNTEEAIDL